MPATIATLRAFADRMTDEDTRAEAILAGASGRLARRVDAAAGATPGVADGRAWCRKLIARHTTAVETMPPDAVETMTIAHEIAEHLDPADHPSDTVVRLRGAAWRDKAYALFYVGKFAEQKQRFLPRKDTFVPAWSANMNWPGSGSSRRSCCVRSSASRKQAMPRVASAKTFERHGDLDKTVSARLAEVHCSSAGACTHRLSGYCSNWSSRYLLRRTLRRMRVCLAHSETFTGDSVRLSVQFTITTVLPLCLMKLEPGPKLSAFVGTSR